MTKILFTAFLLFIGIVACPSAQAQHITYHFPQWVHDHLERYMADLRQNGDTTLRVLILASLGNGEYRLDIADDFRDAESKLIRDTLVETTTRFVRIGKVLHPLITWEDIRFANFGTVPPRVLGGKPGRKIIYMNAEFYNIKFREK